MLYRVGLNGIFLFKNKVRKRDLGYKKNWVLCLGEVF